MDRRAAETSGRSQGCQAHGLGVILPAADRSDLTSTISPRPHGQQPLIRCVHRRRPAGGRNAVNQALKEIPQRYDFKGTHCTIEYDRPKAEIRLAADDEFRMEALVDVLQTRMIKRGVPMKNLDVGELVPSTGQSVRRTVKLTQGIAQEIAKKVIRAVKDGGFKKAQATIQGDEIRVTSPSRDELQAIIAFLRGQDFGIELKFGNYRG